MPKKPNIPTYIPGRRAGLDPARRRYYLPNGTQITKQHFKNIQASKAGATPLGEDPSEQYGFYLDLNRSPESSRWSALENMIAAGERGEDLSKDPLLQKVGAGLNMIAGFVTPDVLPKGTKADPIPTGIRSAYSLVDYYYDRYGDLAQTIEAPIDVALNKLEIEGEYETELKDLYDRSKLNMDHVLYQIMFSVAKYGSAYPFEVYGEEDGQPKKVILLPPRYMWVGYHATQNAIYDSSTKMMPLPHTYMENPPYQLRPLDDGTAWTKALMETTVKPISYGPMADRWNQQNPGGSQSWGLPIPLQYMDVVRTKALDYERYAMPRISRAFTNLSTRMGFHEARRAILEGHKNQLWFFVLGEKDRPPSPEEMAAFKATINGMTGHRTGNLVWRFGADAKVLAPNALQSMLANETAVLFDLAVARDLGVNIRLTTGNPAGITGSGGGEGLDIDLSIMLRRLEFERTQLLNWEYGYRLRMAKRLGGEKAVKAAKNTEVRFSQSLLDISEIVKKEVQPMYMLGLYSPQTSLKRTGRSYEAELVNKKEHQPNQELFFPSPTYNQTTQGATGTSNASSPQGRPAANVSPAKIKASWEDDDTRLAHVTDVLMAYADFVKNGDADEFIQRLYIHNNNHLVSATHHGYHAAGGLDEPDVDVLVIAANFVNAFLPGFAAALKTVDKRDDAQMIARALLYPQEGYKMAVLNGQNQAMRERGAKSWKRIVKAHGCEACTADAQLLHAIEEPFQVLHPNEACPGQEQYIQYFIGGLPSIEIPVPGSKGDYSSLVEEILGTSDDRSRRRKK